MSPEKAKARAVRIAVERWIGYCALIVSVSLVYVLWPDPLPKNPAYLLEQKASAPKCPDFPGSRKVDLEAELKKPKPDFTDADLRGVDLTTRGPFVNVSFRNANLQNAKLAGVEFSDRTDLTCADLTEATGNKDTAFLNAKLIHASMAGAVFEDTDFRTSDLTAANLTNARLKGAIMHGTILTGAILNGTSIKGAEMSHARVGLADYRPIDAPNGAAARTMDGLSSIRLGGANVSGLELLAKAFEAAKPSSGILDMPLRQVRAATARWHRYFIVVGEVPASNADKVWAHVLEVLNGWVSADGSQPFRPFWLFSLSTLGFGLLYWVVFTVFGTSAPVTYRVKVGSDIDDKCPLPGRTHSRIPTALAFSLYYGILVPALLGLGSGLFSSLNALKPYKIKGGLHVLVGFQMFVSFVWFAHYIPWL